MFYLSEHARLKYSEILQKTLRTIIKSTICCRCSSQSSSLTGSPISIEEKGVIVDDQFESQICKRCESPASFSNHSRYSPSGARAFCTNRDIDKWYIQASLMWTLCQLVQSPRLTVTSLIPYSIISHPSTSTHKEMPLVVIGLLISNFFSSGETCSFFSPYLFFKWSSIGILPDAQLSLFRKHKQNYGNSK